MTSTVRVCRMGDSVSDVERIMRQAAVRRLPVVDVDDKLIGIISIADIAREIWTQTRSEQPRLKDSELIETLASICSPG